MSHKISIPWSQKYSKNDMITSLSISVKKTEMG